MTPDEFCHTCATHGVALISFLASRHSAGESSLFIEPGKIGLRFAGINAAVHAVLSEKGDSFRHEQPGGHPRAHR